MDPDPYRYCRCGSESESNRTNLLRIHADPEELETQKAIKYFLLKILGVSNCLCACGMLNSLGLPRGSTKNKK
jgi:hypothetical protein